MRALLALVVIAACTPEIAPGTYFCGPEQDCPAGQACDGPTNTCVLDTAALPFECGEVSEVEPNDGFGNAELVAGLQCVSRVAEVSGCTRADGNNEDWYQFSVPAICVEVNATARLVFPRAFEALAIDLVDANGTTRASGTPCSSDDPGDGDDALCIDEPVTASSSYAFRISGAGTADCGGACAYNRYLMSMQLAGP